MNKGETEDSLLNEQIDRDLKDSFDLFGDEEFEEEVNESFGCDLFGDEELFGDDDLSGDELEIVKPEGSPSNMEDWLSSDGNPELINMGDKNPHNAIFFRSPDFDYNMDYNNIRFIFERFRSELLKGE